jgi:hypothetical protein
MSNTQREKIVFAEAECEVLKIKLGLRGPSGSGKTMGAIKLAYGLCKDYKKIFVVDTELSAGMVKRYTGPFMKTDLCAPYHPQKFLNCFEKAVELGAEVVIFDSISHLWSGAGGFLDINSELAKAKFNNNTFAAWNHTTNLYYKPFVDRVIMQNDVHVIFTMRTKTDYAISTDEKNKTSVKKIGTKEDMRDGFEYELSLCFNLDEENIAYASKDRLNIFKSRFFVINETHGTEIADWLNSNPSPPPPPPPQPVEKIAEPEPIAPAAEPKTEPIAPAAEPKTEPIAPAAEPKTSAAVETSTNLTHNDVRKKESYLLYINYYLPFLSSLSIKLLDRTNQVIKEGDFEKIKKAYQFLREREDDLNKIVEKQANKWLERVMVKQSLAEKILVRNEMPDAIRQSKVIQSYFAALIPPGEK